ncbi:MAG: hypothetical protein ABSA67_18285 [Candidatus Brocadiia bacterium]|jgi:hypothetical protein
MIQGRVSAGIPFAFKTDQQGLFPSGELIQKAFACPACGYVELYLDAAELKAQHAAELKAQR